jgi:hypothetical protein
MCQGSASSRLRLYQIARDFMIIMLVVNSQFTLGLPTVLHSQFTLTLSPSIQRLVSPYSDSVLPLPPGPRGGSTAVPITINKPHTDLIVER